MSAFPYMRFFVGDYLGDTRHLTTLEHGAYLMLIFAYWQRGKPLPADDRKLAHIAGLTRPQWLKVKANVVEFFHQKSDEIVHHRIEREIEHMLSKSLKSQGAGRTSAQRRLNKRSTKPESIDHSPEEEVEPDKSGSRRPAEAGDECLPLDDEPPSGGSTIGEKYTAPFEQWWLSYPNKEGKRKASQAYEAAFKRLGGQRAGTERVHGVLLDALLAQCRIWKRRSITGRYIPHASTWLTRSGFSDEPVREEMTSKKLEYVEPAQAELSPPMEAPPADKRAKWDGKAVGWSPDDEEER